MGTSSSEVASTGSSTATDRDAEAGTSTGAATTYGMSFEMTGSSRSSRSIATAEASLMIGMLARFALYGTAAVYYWVICLALSFGQGRIERRLERYVAR